MQKPPTKEEIKYDQNKKYLEMVLTGDLSTCMKEYEFTKLIHDPQFVEEWVFKLYEKEPKRIRDTQHLKLAIPYCDKKMYS